MAGEEVFEIGKADVKKHLDDLLHNGSAKRKGSGSPVTAIALIAS